MNDMAEQYALSLKTYKNTVPCGGYKLTGGGTDWWFGNKRFNDWWE